MRMNKMDEAINIFYMSVSYINLQCNQYTYYNSIVIIRQIWDLPINFNLILATVNTKKTQNISKLIKLVAQEEHIHALLPVK